MPLRQANEFEVGQIIALLQTGLSQRNVSEQLGISRSAVNRIWIRYNQTGDTRRRRGQGRRRITTEREDRIIRRRVITNRTSTARQVVEHLSIENNRISDQTVRNRLREVNLRARRPVSVPALSCRHRRERLHYANTHVNWRQRQWHRVLFTDESRFALYFNDGRLRVWRRVGEQYNADCVQQRIAFNGGSVMVWGGVSWNTRTDLVIIPPPGLNAQRYIDEILEPHVVPQRRDLGPQFLLLQDNARSHTARLTQQFLRQNDIQTINHPAMSPDLNPIEHVWDMLSRDLRSQYQPQNLGELGAALQQAWQQLPQQIIQRCINMRQRLQEVIRNRGGNTRY